VQDAIAAPVTMQFGDYAYTFTDIQRGGVGEDEYLFARLTKFVPEGAIGVVEPDRHVASQTDIPNLLFASSPFVYLPAFSGLVYQHQSSKLPRIQFEKVFPRLLAEKFDRFFAEAEIEPISDLRTFVQRIASLDVVTRLHATVHPPNPLFGPAWASLREHLRTRRVAQLDVAERANGEAGIATSIPQIAQQVLEADTTAEQVRVKLAATPPNVADAAVLMAADGYGRAKVEGRRAGRGVVVRTQDSQLDFTFEREPEPEQLAELARQRFARINDERYLDH
jgi:hypothetical protein